MDNLIIYQLQPPVGGGFHFGEEGLELEDSSLTFASDSLFAAIVAALAEQEGAAAADDFMAPFENGQPPFRLSSAFPYVGHLPLLPLPRLRVKTASPDKLPRKFTKKVAFVSPAIFRRLCAGQVMDAYLDTEQAGCFLQDGTIWLTRTEAEALPVHLQNERVWLKARVPRVTLDRRSGQSTPYRSGRVGFNEGCGLWLAVQYHDLDSRQRLELLLHHLGDRGIGGERTNGYGAYSLIVDNDLAAPDKWLLPDDHNGRLLLSRFIPMETEVALLQQAQAAYHLAMVGGWLYSPQHKPLRRKRVRMLTEGSVLPGAVEGKLVDVQPDYKDFPHKVYRNGLALTVPVTLSEEMP